MIRRFVLLGITVITTILVHGQKIAVSKGQKLEAVNNSKMIMNMEMAGQSLAYNMESVSTATVELKDVDKDGFVFTNTTKRMTMHMEGLGQDVSFDSDKKEDMDGEMGKAIKENIGKEQQIQVDKNGKIVKMDTDTTAGAGGGVGQMMNMTGTLMKGQPYPMLLPFPGHVLKTGDLWTDSTGSPETVKMVMHYTVKSMSKDEIVLTYTGRLAKKGTLEQQGMQFDLDMGGDIKGEATYETATGLVKTSTSSSDIKGTLGIMGQSAPMTMTVTAGITAKKL